jgi:hypothetical protein
VVESRSAVCHPLKMTMMPKRCRLLFGIQRGDAGECKFLPPLPLCMPGLYAGSDAE